MTGRDSLLLLIGRIDWNTIVAVAKGAAGAQEQAQRAGRSAAANKNKQPAFARDVRRLTHVDDGRAVEEA